VTAKNTARIDMKKFSLNFILENPGHFDGWLYLPSEPWSMTTKGFFYSIDINLSPDEEQKIRGGYENEGWKSTLSGDDVEDLVHNCQEQIENPTVEQLLEAFIFFYKNDAFKEWWE
jgi:hypothetical protein